MEINTFVNSGSAVVAAIVAVLGTLYKAIRSILEFNDEYLRKRSIKYFSYLEAESSDHKDVAWLVKQAKEEELVRSLVGKPLSPIMINAVITLYRSNYLSLAEIRASLIYSKLRDDGLLEVNPGRSGLLIYAVSGLFIVVLGLYSVSLSYLLLSAKTVSGSVAALAILAFYFVFALAIGRDVRAVTLARGVNKKMQKYNICINET